MSRPEISPLEDQPTCSHPPPPTPPLSPRMKLSLRFNIGVAIVECILYNSFEVNYS